MRKLLAWALLVLSAGSAQAQPAPPVLPQSLPCPAAGPKQEKKKPAVVVLLRAGWVVIEAEQPLAVGDRFYIYSQKTVRGIDPRNGQMGWVPEGEQTGMLVIERVDGQQGAGRLLRNAYAEVGDLAVPTTDAYQEHLTYGRRFSGVYRIRADVAFAPLFASVTGLGMLSQMAVEYRFGGPLKLAVELGPTLLVSGLPVESAFGVPSGNLTTFSGSLRGVIGLALSGFELSAGVGAAVDTGRLAAWAPQMGLSVRLGSLDGVNLEYQNYFFLPMGQRPLEFDNGVGSISIPVHRRLSLLFTAGGGLPTFGFGTFGFRIYTQGTGGKGTTIVNASVGGIAVTPHTECPPPTTADLNCTAGNASAAGPLFHLGFEHRF